MRHGGTPGEGRSPAVLSVSSAPERLRRPEAVMSSPATVSKTEITHFHRAENEICLSNVHFGCRSCRSPADLLLPVTRMRNSVVTNSRQTVTSRSLCIFRQITLRVDIFNFSYYKRYTDSAENQLKIEKFFFTAMLRSGSGECSASFQVQLADCLFEPRNVPFKQFCSISRE